MFNEYNPMQYLAIDIANYFGHDKMEYEDRIEWVKKNIDDLELLSTIADEPYLYMKAVNALRQTQQGQEVGHTVALDAICSGLQIMSAVMGCKAGCTLTGLVLPNKRTDAYTLLTQSMNEHMDEDIEISRAEAKSAVMKGFYGSVKVPKEIFGDLLPQFFETLERECPGAYELLELLRNAWNPDVDINSWALPDGHQAVVPVTTTIETKVHVEELRYTPVVRVQVIESTEKGVSLISNVVHSIDAYVLRTLIRRCNYSPRKLNDALKYLKTAYISNEESVQSRRYEETNIVDMTMLDEVDIRTMATYPPAMRAALIRMIEMSLKHKPFEIITIHDSFACSPVNCNQMRRVYADIMGDLVESTIIDDILNQLYQSDAVVEKRDNVQELATIVRQSNYGIS